MVMVIVTGTPASAGALGIAASLAAAAVGGGGSSIAPLPAAGLVLPASVCTGSAG